MCVDRVGRRFVRCVAQHSTRCTCSPFPSDDTFATLAESVDSILHNGAMVNWIMTYAQLAPANVVSTKDLLQLATTHHLKPMHYVSTVSTTHLGGKESDMLPKESALRSSGYLSTKWLAEVRALRVCACTGEHHAHTTRRTKRAEARVVCQGVWRPCDCASPLSHHWPQQDRLQQHYRLCQPIPCWLCAGEQQAVCVLCPLTCHP